MKAALAADPCIAPAQLDAHEVARVFVDARFGPFYGVPCSYLGPLISVLSHHFPQKYQAAGNEGEAVALAAGAQLAGLRPVVILQNSGLGNAVNPLTSLCHTLRVPVLLLVTWRGQPGRSDEPQHELMGRITRDLLDAMEIRSEIFPSVQRDLPAALHRASRHMHSTSLPYALLVPKGTLAQELSRSDSALASIQYGLRREAIGAIVRTSDPDTVLIATTGKTARELERDHDRATNLYVVGSMGCASSIALGVALNARHRDVIVIDGDGAVLMRMEAMATIGRSAAERLTHIVLDNGSYESTGGQATHSGAIDLATVAAACGYRSHANVDSMSELRDAIGAAQATRGPHFIRAHIRAESDPALGRPALRPPDVATRFRQAVRP